MKAYSKHQQMLISIVVGNHAADLEKKVTREAYSNAADYESDLAYIKELKAIAQHADAVRLNLL